MSLPLAIGCTAAASVIGNRIIAVGVGFLVHLPRAWLLGTVLAMDVVQIPFYYWLYESGGRFLTRLPQRMRRWLERDPSVVRWNRWAHSLGAFSVLVIAALPSFGGGVWSAVFLSHTLRLRKRWSYPLVSLGSAVSFLGLYWMTNTLFMAVRYFSRS